MAVTTQATNTLTATVGATPDNLANVAGPGTFQLLVDCNAMAALDIVFLSIKLMVRTGGTARYVYDARFDGAQPAKDLIKVSVPVSHSITDSTALVFELNQTAGTARAFPWTILKFS
jgi:hypothetical protein